MAPDPTAWQVHPHDPIEQLADNLWRVEGDVPRMQLRRCMTVARLRSGDLVLHSAIALDDEGMAKLESFGRPAWLVVPNGWHRIDAARYKARYPDMKVICPSGSRRNVEKVVAVDATYDDSPRLDPEDDTVEFEQWQKKKMEGVMMVRSPDGVTAVFCDALFNLPHGKGLFWWFYGRVLGSTGGPRVTVIGRLFLLAGGGKVLYRDWLSKTADRGDVVRLIPGHGGVVKDDATQTLRNVAASL